MKIKPLDNQPISDELIDTLSESDLTMAALTAKLTPEQDARIKARLVQIFRARHPA